MIQGPAYVYCIGRHYCYTMGCSSADTMAVDVVQLQRSEFLIFHQTL
jgi:hypothetical protein